IAVVRSRRTVPSSARAPAAAARMIPDRAPRVPGQGISWLSSTSASVKSLWLNSKRGSTRSITPIVSIGSGSELAGRMRSVAARTAASRSATLGLRASASATSDCKPESPATGGESCACAGPAPANTNALAVRISCRSCIPLLANQFPAERAGARAVVSGASGHTYAWERLGLGRWRERCFWVGGGEGRDPETDNVGLSCGGGNGSTKRDHCGRCDRAERRVSARASVAYRTDRRPRPVRGHLLLAARRRCSLDLVAQQRQANRQHLAAQQQRGDESDECEFHARSGIYYDAVSVVTTPQFAEAGIGSSRTSRRRSSRQVSAKEPFGMPSTHRSARRRWLAWSQSSC